MIGALTQLLAQSEVQADAARRWALMLGLLTLAVVLLLVSLLAAWALRRGRRMRAEADAHAPTAITDAWAEAGRRARGDLLDGEQPLEPDERRP